MKRGIAKVMAGLFVCLGVMLSASSSPAQSIGARTRGARSVAPGLPQYNFTLIDVPGTIYTGGASLNSVGQIVGGYGPLVQSQWGDHGFQVSIGKKGMSETFRTIDFPKSTNQTAFGINDSGEIVGVYNDSAGVSHGYARNKKKFTTLDVPFSGATGTIAIGINLSGDVVGGWTVASNFTHGFELSGGTYTQLDYPGAVQTFANGINVHGDIVGYWSDSSTSHGFLLSGGTYTSIDVPGATVTFANALNDSGDIVGVYCTTNQCLIDGTGQQGFLLKGGTFTTIDFPGASVTQALGINNSGQILGDYLDCVGVFHTFLAIPQ